MNYYSRNVNESPLEVTKSLNFLTADKTDVKIFMGNFL